MPLIVYIKLSKDLLEFRGQIRLTKWRTDFKIGTHELYDGKSIFHGFEITGSANSETAYFYYTYYAPEEKYGTFISGEGDIAACNLPLSNSNWMTLTDENGWKLSVRLQLDSEYTPSIDSN